MPDIKNSPLAESIEHANQKRVIDTEEECFNELSPLRQQLAFAVREQIFLEKNRKFDIGTDNIQQLEEFYELISTDEGFLGQIELPPGNLTVKLSQEALDIRLRCNSVITKKMFLLRMGDEHNSHMNTTEPKYSDEEELFFATGEDAPVEIGLRTEKRIRELKNALPDDIKNTLNYYFPDVLRSISVIADKINERGYFYLAQGYSHSEEFLNDMRELSTKLRFAEDVDRGIGAQHKEYADLDVNESPDLSDEEIDGYFNLIEIEDEDNLTLLEAEEVACMYERIRLRSIFEGVAGNENMDAIKLKVLMLIKGIMHHLYELNYRMIEEEIKYKEDKDEQIHPLLHVNSMFDKAFRIIRGGNNISGTLGIVKQ